MNSIWFAFVIGSAVPLVAMWAVDVSTSYRSALWSLGIGALSALPAAIIGHSFEGLPQLFRVTPEWRAIVSAFVAAGLVEEAVRYLTIGYAARCLQGASSLHVIRAAVWISLGFAIVENAAFVAVTAIDWPDRVLETAFSRVTLPTLMHVFCGIIVAAAVLKLFGRFSFAALLGAIFFHGLYDSVAMWERHRLEHLALLLIAGWLASEVVIRIARLRDAEMTKRMG